MKASLNRKGRSLWGRPAFFEPAFVWRFPSPGCVGRHLETASRLKATLLYGF